MTEALLLDEHYSEDIAQTLRDKGHDVLAVVALPELRGGSDETVYRFATENNRRVVTENIKDFRPLLLAKPADDTGASLLLVPPRRFPRGSGKRQAAIVAALDKWLAQLDRPPEDWLSA